jgi:Rrf2 family protein
MLISTKGRYALRVLVDMAERQAEGYIPLKEIAERQEISEKYLESIVKELVKNEVVTGVRGKGGGYRLRKTPEQINVGEVLRYMEGSLSPVACLEDGAAPCERSARCRTLEFWQGLDEAIRSYTSGYTLADLVQTGQPGNDYVI